MAASGCPRSWPQSGVGSSRSARPTAPGAPTSSGAIDRPGPRVDHEGAHRRNYRIVGFTEDAPVASAGRRWAAPRRRPRLGPARRSLPVARRAVPGVAARRARRRARRSTPAPTLVTFSGDKLLGGPQAGIIAAAPRLLDVMRRIRWPRALRPGRLVLAAMQDVLRSRTCAVTGATSRSGAMATRPVAEFHAAGRRNRDHVPSATSSSWRRRSAVARCRVRASRRSALAVETATTRRARHAAASTRSSPASTNGAIDLGDLRTVDPGRRPAPRRGAAPHSRCTSSPPRDTSTTASRRWSTPSPAPTPTVGRREAPRPHHRSRLRLASCRRDGDRASSTCPVTSGSSRTCSPVSAPSTWCMFVVAADEGWMPQSREHLQILDLLGARAA